MRWQPRIAADGTLTVRARPVSTGVPARLAFDDASLFVDGASASLWLSIPFALTPTIDVVTTVFGPGRAIASVSLMSGGAVLLTPLIPTASIIPPVTAGTQVTVAGWFGLGVPTGDTPGAVVTSLTIETNARTQPVQGQVAQWTAPDTGPAWG